jgi:L-alanine-DL-glutamate epimerase-like enolase superfamily enzyme
LAEVIAVVPNVVVYFANRQRPRVRDGYATIYQGAVGDRTVGQMMDATAELFERALRLGFRAVKLEVIWGGLVTDRELVACIAEGRSMLGEDVTLLVDFGYRWRDWREALWALSRLEQVDLYLAEAVLRHDDLAGHAKLAGRVPTRVGGAEMAATVHECREWLREGGVDALQPDPAAAAGSRSSAGFPSWQSSRARS